MNRHPDLELPSYDAPPLNEVVYGISFKHLSGLTAPHVGLYWSSIKENFPIVQHAPLILSNRVTELYMDNYPFQRTWFIQENDNYLIQLQSDKFLYNWRSKDKTAVYPRHNKVHKEFHENYKIFQSFVEQNNIGFIVPTEYELSYVNHINVNEGWKTLKDIGKIVKDMKWKSGKRFLPEPKYLTSTFGFDMPDNCGRLTIKINPVFRQSDGLPILNLELTAKSTDANVSADQWFAMAREWIVKGFEDFTTTNAQEKLWKKIKTG